MTRRIAMLALATMAGCAAPKPKSSAAMAARPLSVQAPGALADAPVTALTPSILTERVHDLERRGRAGAAARLAALHADVARAALESVSGRPDPAVRSLAAACDRAFAYGADGWAAVFALRVREPARFADYDAAHAAVASAFARGALEEALESLPLPVPADAPGAARLYACSRRLEGLAALAQGDHAAALAAFEHAGSDAALFHVLAMATADRAGDDANAASARDRALLALAEAAASHPRRREPALLERAVATEAGGAAIDAAATAALERAAARDLGLETAGGAVAAAWTIAGFDRLARGEPRAALTDLRRAEEAGADPLARARLREAQARALLALGEPAAARALLGVLAADADPRAARPALATLGAIELRLDRPDIAAGLLRRALEEPALDWPGASAARANLGLALLLAGLDEEGLRHLRAAQAHFELEQDHEALMQALENEKQAHELAGRSEEVETLRARIASSAGR